VDDGKCSEVILYSFDCDAELDCIRKWISCIRCLSFLICFASSFVIFLMGKRYSTTALQFLAPLRFLESQVVLCSVLPGCLQFS